eukprot:787240-Amorphochlora_amoeboformis.AAC.1
MHIPKPSYIPTRDSLEIVGGSLKNLSETPETPSDPEFPGVPEHLQDPGIPGDPPRGSETARDQRMQVDSSGIPIPGIRRDSKGKGGWLLVADAGNRWRE